jgi:ubiquinone/menaquinone biosynthesis C-methylase UbiE
LSEGDRLFAGSIPEVYDSYLVPLLFEGFAKDLAERVAALAPESVLETAAGTGVVTRALRAKLRPDARYSVTDLNQPMLDHAAVRQGLDSRISWRRADALDLPFEDASFDVVCCQFGVMFLPDRVAGYAEARRVLRTGGTFLFSVWDRIEENEFANFVTDAVATVFPDNPPQFLARAPHGYHDVSLIRDELAKAGFSRISISTLEQTSRAPSPRHVAVAYCQGTPLRNEIEARDPNLLGLVTDRATEAIASRCGSGPVSGTIQGHVVVAGA